MNYKIMVKGTLDAAWADVFNGMTITTTISHDGQPLTRLTGQIHDQAALRGMMNKLWDLNLVLISVQCEEVEEESDDH